MSRKRRAPKKIPLVDHKYKSTIITKLINSIMFDGKKTIAEKIVYDAIEKIKSKLSFKYQYELEQLPNEIDNFQKKILEINNELKDTNLYLDNYDKFTSITKELTTLKDQLYQKEERWLKLLELQEKYE